MLDLTEYENLIKKYGFYYYRKGGYLKNVTIDDTYLISKYRESNCSFYPILHLNENTGDIATRYEGRKYITDERELEKELILLSKNLKELQILYKKTEINKDFEC